MRSISQQKVSLAHRRETQDGKFLKKKIEGKIFTFVSVEITRSKVFILYQVWLVISKELKYGKFLKILGGGRKDNYLC